jgi:hypothetical protein
MAQLLVGCLEGRDMRFCQDHWDRLRKKIEERGLSVLISENGEEAAKKLFDQLNGEKPTLDNFDPLMNAHWAIFGNVVKILPQATGYLMDDSSPQDNIWQTGMPFKFFGKTWPRCPLCYIGIAHELTCEGCDLPTVNGYDWMLDKAADEQLAIWQSLKP